MASSSTSVFYNLLSRMLVDEMFASTPPLDTPGMRNDNDTRGNTTVNSASTQTALVEIMREYNTTFRQYNNNINQYNRNIERIIHLVSSTDSTHQSNTNTIRETAWPSDLSYNYLNTGYRQRNNIVENPYSTSYRNRNRDASSNYIHIDTPIQVPETPRVLFRHFQFPETFMNGNTYLGRINNILHQRDNATDGLTETQIERTTDELVFDLEHFAENNLSTQCPISLDEFAQGETLLQLRNCKHVFRPSELRRWFSQHSRCPVCRASALQTTEGHMSDISYNRVSHNGPTGNAGLDVSGNQIENPSEYTNTYDNYDDYSDMPELIENFADNAYHFEYSYYFEFPQNQFTT